LEGLLLLLELLLLQGLDVSLHGGKLTSDDLGKVLGIL
jgi:hypothetical protein